MTKTEIYKLALETAAESPCKKRKVGAVIIGPDGTLLSTGFNYNTLDCECEDVNGDTIDSVIHAEIAAIEEVANNKILDRCTIYVTHQPCDNCMEAINKYFLKYEVVTSFMKFDTGKLRYGLVPPSATKAMAEVLTYGAKKYKPNNWKEADDIDRYVDALYRHLESWRAGESHDDESGLSHLSHALTNIAFLIHFENQ